MQKSLAMYRLSSNLRVIASLSTPHNTEYFLVKNAILARTNTNKEYYLY